MKGVEASPAGAIRERAIPCETCGTPHWDFQRRCRVCRALCVPEPKRLLSEPCPTCEAKKWEWSTDCATCLPDPHDQADTAALMEKYER